MSVCAHCIQMPNFYSAAGYKNSGLTEHLSHVEETGRPMSSLLPYTFKNACFLLQLVLWAAGELQCRWIWASLFFLPFVTAHLKSQEPEAQDE